MVWIVRVGKEQTAAGCRHPARIATPSGAGETSQAVAGQSIEFKALVPDGPWPFPSGPALRKARTMPASPGFTRLVLTEKSSGQVLLLQEERL